MATKKVPVKEPQVPMKPVIELVMRNRKYVGVVARKRRQKEEHSIVVNAWITRSDLTPDEARNLQQSLADAIADAVRNALPYTRYHVSEIKVSN